MAGLASSSLNGRNDGLTFLGYEKATDVRTDGGQVVANEYELHRYHTSSDKATTLLAIA